MHVSRVFGLPQDRREPAQSDASGTTGRGSSPSARIFLEARWAGRVRSPVERSRVAVMRLRFREPIWSRPGSQRKRDATAVRAAIMGRISRELPRVVTISALFSEPGSFGGGAQARCGTPRQSLDIGAAIHVVALLPDRMDDLPAS